MIIALREYAHENINTIIFFVKVDCDGLGVGVYDRLKEQEDDILKQIRAVRDEMCLRTGDESNAADMSLSIVECHFGGMGGTLDEGDPVKFANKTGLMWGRVRKLLKEEALSVWDNEELIAQLSNRKYTVSSRGKIELEKKEDMKKRGVSSPDIADALALALFNETEDYTFM